MSDFVCFHCTWNEIFTEDGTTLDEALMGERAEIITAFLGEFPFTHFESEMGWVKAFADENDIVPADYSVIEASVEDFIDSFAWSVVKRENWNEMWEKNFFEPLLVGDFFVRAPFHPAAPAGRRTITIEPRMSFGTGHHGTTRLMLTALQEMDAQQVNILTVEDPIEYELPGVGQTQVNPRIDLDFARALRSILRQDPDVIMIGEIRDQETAQIAIQASLTGHLVLATLHTNDAPSAVTRLLDMGVEPFLLSSSLLGVLAQRLVRKWCPHCHGQG